MKLRGAPVEQPRPIGYPSKIRNIIERTLLSIAKCSIFVRRSAHRQSHSLLPARNMMRTFWAVLVLVVIVAGEPDKVLHRELARSSSTIECTLWWYVLRNQFVDEVGLPPNSGNPKLYIATAFEPWTPRRWILYLSADLIQATADARVSDSIDLPRRGAASWPILACLCCNSGKLLFLYTITSHYLTQMS